MVTTTTQIPPAVSEFYDRTLLVRALPLLVHDRWGQRRPVPKNTSAVIKFRRYNSLAANTTALTEGTTPTGKQLSRTDITATLAQYGDFTILTDVVSLINVESVITEGIEVLGEQAGNSLDRVYRSVLVAGTNVVYANNVGARNQVVSVLSTGDLDKAITIMKENNARPFTEVIAGRDRSNTTPIASAYFAICHPHHWKTLKAMSDFIPVQKYPDPSVAVEGEIGSYQNLRFVETTNAMIWTGAGGSSTSVRNTAGVADVYAILVFGKDAYGISELSGEGMRTYVKPVGSSGSADPINQRGSIGWKAFTTCKILDDSFMLRIECAAAL